MGEVKNGLLDIYERRIDYLRISVTDRCNLRCFYCMPNEGVPFMAYSRILRYEEILRLTDIFLEMGIKKIRITGGEPLIRKNILFLVKELGKRKSLRELTLTTNGIRLSEYAYGLVQAGVERVNVSLDSLNKKNYKQITGVNLFNNVMQGINISQELGLKIKLNIVAMRGRNDGEFLDFLKFGIENDIDIRFIELMPQYYNDSIAENLFIPEDEVLKMIEKMYTLIPGATGSEKTTAKLYKIKNSRVTVGFISAVSHPFCSGCNKIRLMPDGTLRTCLFGDSGVNLKNLLGEKKTKKEIKVEIVKAVKAKPEKHNLNEEWPKLVMHRVGG